MPILDKREIEFDADALVYCLSVSPRAAEGFGLPPMQPSEVRFYPEGSVVDVIYSKRDGLGAVRISAASLGALLIAYCIRAKFPMPRAADKSIRVEADCIVLAFRSRFSKVPAPEAAESSSRAAEAIKSWKWIAPGQATLRS